jgi:hypothetical protein
MTPPWQGDPRTKMRMLQKEARDGEYNLALGE